MISRKVTAYLDAKLSKRLEALTLNLLPAITHSSDLSILYIAETDVKDSNGYPTQTTIETGDSVFVSIVDEAGFINFENVKLLHVPNVLESDFETTSLYPSNENMKFFASYYEGREVSELGGWLDFAICPFGTNEIELLNGDIVKVYGRGRIHITYQQRGLKGYKTIPKVRKILSMGAFKILKLALYSKFTWNMSNTYSLNLFSPSMRIEQEKIEDRLKLSNNKVSAYVTSKNGMFGENGLLYNQKDNSILACKNIEKGIKSEYYGIGDRIFVPHNGYIDLTSIKDTITDEFTIHINGSLRDYANRGTILFEIGYAEGQFNQPSRFITLWINSDGFIHYNTSFMNEATNTGVIFPLNIENSITFTISSEKYDEEDNEEYTTFIHFNGKQIWPKQEMPYEYQREYMWKGMTAWKTYQEVCLNLKNPFITGVLDPGMVCTKKLLHESGFMKLDDLKRVFDLYTNRPRACGSDLNLTKINTIYKNPEDPSQNYNSTIQRIILCQDAFLDTSDSEYYANFEVSDALVCGKRLTRKQIELIHTLNSVKLAAVENDIPNSN